MQHVIYTIIVLSLITLFSIGISALVVWTVTYVSNQEVHFTFDVPERFNATYFTLDTPWLRENVGSYTALPYTFHSWWWEGHTISLTVHYYVQVQIQEPVQDFNGTNITIIPIQPVYKPVGSETFVFILTKHSGEP